jgi:hypothetical protein
MGEVGEEGGGQLGRSAVALQYLVQVGMPAFQLACPPNADVLPLLASAHLDEHDIQALGIAELASTDELQDPLVHLLRPRGEEPGASDHAGGAAVLLKRGVDALL